MRCKIGDTISVFDGFGGSFLSIIEEMSLESTILNLKTKSLKSVQRTINIVQGLPKSDKFELVLQKCTELGATEFFPVSSERSVVNPDKFSAGKVARWQAIVTAACAQSRNDQIPKVNSPIALIECVSKLALISKVLVLSEVEAGTRLGVAFLTLPPEVAVSLVIGPEGGWSPQELSKLDGQQVSLGSRILRTETAAMAALSIVRHLDGSLG